MATRDWLGTWETWRSALNAHGAVIQAFVVEPPAQHEDVAAAEKRLGRPLPSSLRDVLLTFSAHVWFKWYWKHGPTEPRALRNLSRHGELEWNCATLQRYRADNDDPTDEIFMYGEEGAVLYRETVVFQEVANGDALAVDFRTGAVVYLDHEGGPDHGVVLAPSFASFVTSYSEIGCSGSDWDVLAPVHVDGRLDPQAPFAQQWRACLGLPHASGVT
ncbi:hypothetical protein BH09GEM1_BH09GEM1_09610 [soil metagenome]